MAEGFLGGVLGEEDDKPESESPDAATGAEAFASAIAAIASRQDPGVARKTEEFLNEQTHLLKLQSDHLEEEFEARLHFLRGQASEVDIRRFGLRLRIAFQLVVALVSVAVGIGVVLLIHDAVTSRQVVIEAFDAPANLAAKGLTGKVIAGGVLDELTRLQIATRSHTAPRRSSGAWAEAITLEIPDTGISIETISRLLRNRFGHDVHIYGDVVERSDGRISLSVRGNGIPPKSFAGNANEIEHAFAEAAEFIYSKSQPARWAGYLVSHGRLKEAISFCQSAFDGSSPEDRSGLLHNWAVAVLISGGSKQEALGLFRASLKFEPDSWPAYANIENVLIDLGDEEGAWKAGEEMQKVAGGRPGKAPESSYQNWDLLVWNLQAWHSALVADVSQAYGGANLSAEGPTIADILVRMHDLEAAELAIKTTRENSKDLAAMAMIHHVRGRLAGEAGDLAQAVTELEAFVKEYSDPTVSGDYAGYHCWLAPALEAVGRRKEVDEFLKTAGTFVDCHRFRGDILDGRGDWEQAQKAYAEAVALAPDLPAGYYSWGMALAKRGELVAAESKFKEAHQKGPHWADPLKAWGDIMAKQSRPRDALAKYDEALLYAPNWKQLKEAREAVAPAKG